jgi:ferredoxin-NADP reductase
MEFTATVVGSDHVGPDTVALSFESPPEFEAHPGQFVKLSATVAGEDYARFYTLSSPDVEGTFEVTVEVAEEGGPFSAHLAALEGGDEMAVDGPYGNDFYEGESRVVVVAGGPGIGPAVAIAEAALADGNEAVVVYEYDSAPAHEARLDALREGGASVHQFDEADGETALPEAVTAALDGHAESQVFVYGFAEFVQRAMAAVEGTDADAEGAKVENFG